MAKFNLRVYGIWVNSTHILLSEEWVKGHKIVKFPGGGLEWGEGLKDALKREWKEEMNLNIEVEEHYYTTDFFQKSAYDESQVISIYYKVKPQELIPFPFHNGRERFYWAPLSKTLEEQLSLPIDKIVGAMVAREHRRASDLM